MNVKIERTKLIETLNAALTASKREIKKQEAHNAKVKAEFKKYFKELLEVALQNIDTVKIETWYEEVRITPKSLGDKKPKYPSIQSVSVKGTSELERIIRTLEMSSDKYVSTSVVKSVSSYL